MTMTKSKWIIAGLVVVAALVAAWWALLPGKPATLTELLGDVDGLDQYAVVTPISTQSGLGALARNGTPSPRQMEFESEPCFFTRPKTDRSLEKQVIEYQDSRSFGLEVNQALAKAGLNVKGGGTGTLTLEDLRIESAVGIPNPNGPCRFETGNNIYNVVTRQVVAGRVTLTTTGTIEGDVTAASPSSGDATTGTWKRSGNNSVQGGQLVIAAQTTPVEVTLTTREENLGATPAVGARHSFPEGLTGDVTVHEYDHGEKRLTIEVNASDLGIGGDTPPGVSLCKVGERTQVRLGQACYFWLSSGNALLSVQWNLSTDQPQRVVLRSQAFRTTFAPPPQGR